MDLREETIDSREIYSGKILKLRVDRVRLPNGKESTREIVVHRGAITAVPLLDDGRIVMVRQFRQAAGETLLELPAGTLEPGEDHTECARRELQEEINYTPNHLTLLFASYLAPGYSSELLYTYLAEDLVKAEGQSDADEFLEIVTIPLDEAVEMVSQKQIKDAKSICGILMAHRIIATR
jgi:ADP-ribose pyrophosphatase